MPCPKVDLVFFFLQLDARMRVFEIEPLFDFLGRLLHGVAHFGQLDLRDDVLLLNRSIAVEDRDDFVELGDPVLAVAFDISNLSPFGASPGLFFAGGCVFLVLAVAFGLWRARSMRS